MKKLFCTVKFAVLAIIFLIIKPLQAEEFQYPYYLIGSYNSISECWSGIDRNGDAPIAIDPNNYLVGPPPSIEQSAVTLPTGSWVELLFRGVIFDGPGSDIYLSEIDPVGEQALVFLTDGADQEYLLAFASVPDTGSPNPNEHFRTILDFDLAGLVLPFEPRAIRIVGVDLRGNSPGFDLSYVNARVHQDDNEIASYPYPPNQAENVPFDAVLDWIPGNYSSKHNVYFGNDISSIYPNANPIDNPAQPQSANSFDPNTLEMRKTYYWRIDEVNETDPNIVLAGTPWSFTVADHFMIDDFESYTTENPIDNKWTLVDGSYMLVTNDPKYVYSCSQAMKLDYYYSKTRRTLASQIFEKPQNWIAAGAKSIDINFYGYKYNMTDCNLYVELYDGENTYQIMYNDDITNIRDESWQRWRINLQSEGLLSADMNEIDMTHIESFSIGLQIDLNKTNSYGYGRIYFDEIILYPSRCLPEDKCEADFNGDCIVDFKDFSELANNWLESGYNIYQVQEPKTHPLIMYEFENNLNATYGSSPGHFSDEALDFVPGVYGKAINFDTSGSWVEVDSVSYIISQINEGITIAFWQKGTESTNKRDTLFCSDYYYNDYETKRDPSISINLGCWDRTGIYRWDCGTELPYDRSLSGTHRYSKEWENQWNHWAFTKDLQTGTMQVFLNGVLIKSQSGLSKEIQVFDSFTIGSGWYGDYDGLMDDFRIYNYALSQPEIAYVATNGTGIFDLPIMTPADLNPDNKVDFNDLIVLSSYWLENQLFPDNE